MEFCPKCGCVLIGENKEAKCPRCGHKSKTKVKIESSETIPRPPEIGVIRDKDTDVFPITNALCPKSQTRAGDEAETKFFRCTKCKNTWREYR